ncbi:CvpA family protein [Enterococcus mediterraneensis]|uniref:CvpA family protein n=1 Tax=Enterococcus mediterraneensis TaxID=2364791 RepID=UPI000F06D1C8|nr:CvpA family protein [Enterococcus mediterraneensis]
MIGLIILLILISAFYVGGRRGTPLQIVSTIGFGFSLFVAEMLYEDLAKKLELYIPYPSVTEDSKMVFFDLTTALDLDKAYYAAISFLLVLFGGWLVTKLVLIFFNNLRFKRLLKNYDWLLGGLLNVVIAYTVIFLLLYVLSMVPLAIIQNVFRDSSIARMVVEDTPILSELFHKLWVTNILA